MNKKGYATIGILAIIFVPGVLTFYLITKISNYILKHNWLRKLKFKVAKTI